jgi:hypothetical protein
VSSAVKTVKKALTPAKSNGGAKKTSGSKKGGSKKGFFAQTIDTVTEVVRGAVAGATAGAVEGAAEASSIITGSGSTPAQAAGGSPKKRSASKKD